MESVLSQDWPDIEYLVVDPGSTDNTPEIIRAFQRRFPDRITHINERDNGPADGLNRAFGRATGQLFGYLNADDRYLPGCFRKAVDTAERFQNAAAFYADGYKIDGEGRVLRRVISTTFSPKRFVYGGTLILQQSTFYRADAYRAVGGFNLNNRTSWDVEILFDISRKGMHLVHVPEFWSEFRIHPESITGSQRMAEESRATHARYFRTVMGRDKTALDKVAAKAVLGYTLITEPRCLMARVSDRFKSRLSKQKPAKLEQSKNTAS